MLKEGHNKLPENVIDSEQEKDILLDLCNYEQAKDPDVIVFGGEYYASTTLDYLFARIVSLGLDLNLGREKKEIALLTILKRHGGHWIKGKLSLDSKAPNRYSSKRVKFGFAGLIDQCRFGFLSLDLVAKWHESSNR